MSSLIDTYIAGGVEYMHPLTLLFLCNLGILGYFIFLRTKGRVRPIKWIEAIKHISGVALAFGTFGTLVGFFQAFNALEHMDTVLPFQVIMGGLKVALINILYGLIVFFISMVIYIILKLRTVA
jgi:drug/metabolite transporter (DMT)-like permease